MIDFFYYYNNNDYLKKNLKMIDTGFKSDILKEKKYVIQLDNLLNNLEIIFFDDETKEYYLCLANLNNKKKLKLEDFMILKTNIIKKINYRNCYTELKNKKEDFEKYININDMIEEYIDHLYNESSYRNKILISKDLYEALK